MKTASKICVFTVLGFVLSLIIPGCSSDENPVEPDTSYIMNIGSIDGPPGAAVGDTLWVTFGDAVMADTCHRFDRVEEVGESLLRIFTFYGRVEGEACILSTWTFAKRIPITGLSEGVRTVAVMRGDGTTLSRDFTIYQ